MTSDENRIPPAIPPRDGSGSHKPGRNLRNIVFLILIGLVVGEAAYIAHITLENHGAPAPAQKSKSERKILYWQDPMHPQYTSDKPGKAPDCGMDLEPVYADESGDRRVLYWTDPMNPGSKYGKPGKAPDGMDLVPVYAEQPQGTEGVKISPNKQQLIGVQYGRVNFAPLVKSMRAVAILSYDETKITHVHTKVEGWVDQVYADFTGQLVRKGQPLLSFYSPDLLATQEEYLLALRARERLGGSQFKEVVTGSNSLLEATRRRLELWDISDPQIAEIERTRKPLKNLTIFAPASGFVTARNAYEHLRITPETELYTITDLSTVWAISEFYEYQVRDIRIGQSISLTVPAFPGRLFRGKVNYIYPQMDNTTRTLRVRSEFANPGFALKPEMYANAELRVDYGRRLSVPQEAVLNSGTEQLVFVALEDGYFQPRKVLLGDQVDDRVIVLSGLTAGERIVTSGNFLLDSESNLKSAVGGMGMPEQHGEPPAPQTDHSQHGMPPGHKHD